MVAWSGSPWEFIFILKLCENLHLIANHYHLWQRLGCGQVPQVEIPVWTCAPPASYSTLKIDPRLLKRSRKLWEGVTPRESLTEKVNNVEKLKRFLIFNPQFNWASLNCSTMSYSGSIRAIHSIICYSVCTLYLADACMAIGQWQKKVDYRIIEHDGCGDCGSPKDEHLITNTLHVFSNLTKSLRQMLTCLYILCSWLLYLKYRLQLQKLTWRNICRSWPKSPL